MIQVKAKTPYIKSCAPTSCALLLYALLLLWSGLTRTHLRLACKGVHPITRVRGEGGDVEILYTQTEHILGIFIALREWFGVLLLYEHSYWAQQPQKVQSTRHEQLPPDDLFPS